MSFRIDYTTQVKLTKSALFSVNGIDEKIQQGIFPFISDVFFLGLHAFHVSLMPTVDHYMQVNQQLTRQKAMVQKSKAMMGDAWLSTPEGQRQNQIMMQLYCTADGYDAHLYVLSLSTTHPKKKKKKDEKKKTNAN
jgi:hypothetical protein